MFGLFKKTRWEIDGKIFEFFNELFDLLPTEFQFLSQGLHKGLYRSYSTNFAMKGHHYTIGFDPLQSDKEMAKGKQFQLQNVLIIGDGKEYPLSIIIYDGLWVGFEIEQNITRFKKFRFDLKAMHIEVHSFKKNARIEKLVHRLESNNLDLHDLSEIEVMGKFYYQIKDLEDGNYLAIDDKGQVFGFKCDPFKVELLSKSIKQFVEDVNNGTFDFGRYLNGDGGYIQKRT